MFTREKKKKKQTLSQNSELYGAVTYQILIPSSIVALKTSSLQSQWKPVAWTPFPHLAGCQEDPTRKTCLYLTWLGVYLVQSSLPSRRSWNRSGTLSSQSCHYCMECLGPVIQTSPPPYLPYPSFKFLFKCHPLDEGDTLLCLPDHTIVMQPDLRALPTSLSCFISLQSTYQLPTCCVFHSLITLIICLPSRCQPTWGQSSICFLWCRISST